jgi:hypothetical protein
MDTAVLNPCPRQVGVFAWLFEGLTACYLPFFFLFFSISGWIINHGACYKLAILSLWFTLWIVVRTLCLHKTESSCLICIVSGWYGGKEEYKLTASVNIIQNFHSSFSWIDW